MSKKGFVIGNKGFGLENLGWKEGPGDCNFREELRDSCPKKYSSGRQKDCVNTVTAHCCKHVLNGTSAEREAFQEKAGQDRLPDKFQAYPNQSRDYWRSMPRVTREAQDLEKKTIKNYESLSYRVAQTTALVAVTAHNDQIRFVCSGEGENASGFTDFIQYSVKKMDYYESEDESVDAHYDIVSMFLQDLRVTEFFLMDSLFSKFCEGKRIIDGVKICPAISDSETFGAPPQDRFHFEKDYIELQAILNNTRKFSESEECKQLVAFGMFWHYTDRLADNDDYNISRAIQSVFSSEDPISFSSENPAIKELKKVARYNEAFLREAIRRHYLAWICNVKGDHLLQNKECCISDYWKVTIESYRLIAWRVFFTAFVFKRCMNRLKSILTKKNEMRALMTEDAPYSLADFSAFQLWSDMFTAHACIQLLKKYHEQYTDLFEQDNPSHSPWFCIEDATLETAKDTCSERIHSIVSAFPIPAMDRWRKRFYATFQWDASV